MLTTTHTDRAEALRELATRERESRAKLRTAIGDLLSSRTSLMAAVGARATLLAEIDAAAAADPDSPAAALLADEKRIMLEQLNAQKALLDRGEAALRADPEWAAILDALVS